jgi:hypothetical protein
MNRTCIILLLLVGCAEVETQEPTEWCSKVCEYNGSITEQRVTFDEQGRKTLTEFYADGKLTDSETCTYQGDTRVCVNAESPWTVVDSVWTCTLEDGKETHCDVDKDGDGTIDSALDVERDEHGREVVRTWAGVTCVMDYGC